MGYRHRQGAGERGMSIKEIPEDHPLILGRVEQLTEDQDTRYEALKSRILKLSDEIDTAKWNATRQQRDAEILALIEELELVLDPEDNALHVSGWIAHKIKGGGDKTYFDDRIKRLKTRIQNGTDNKQL